MFITIEGGEGVGKSTFLKELEIALVETYGADQVVISREPGGTCTGKKLRDIFISPPENEPLTIEAEFMIVSAARAEHVRHLILPALEKGQIVLCDRYADSSRAYQGILGGIPNDFINRVISKTTFDLEPNLTVLLDCPVEVSIQRLSRRNGEEDIEGAKRYDEASRATHEKIRNAFLQVANEFPERVIVKDAEKKTSEIVVECLTQIKELRSKLGS